MIEIHKNENYKIMQVNIPAGQIMPLHYATSEAFILVESGEAKLKLPDEIKLLQPGSTTSIPAKLSHSLEILADFRGYVVLAAGATIKFNEN